MEDIISRVIKESSILFQSKLSDSTIKEISKEVEQNVKIGDFKNPRNLKELHEIIEETSDGLFGIANIKRFHKDEYRKLVEILSPKFGIKLPSRDEGSKKFKNVSGKPISLGKKIGKEYFLQPNTVLELVKKSKDYGYTFLVDGIEWFAPPKRWDKDFKNNIRKV